MIGVVAALPDELAAIALAVAEEGAVRTEVVAGQPLQVGRLAGLEVAFALSGVGKAAAASMATLLVQRVDAVVMVGTAGGIGHGVLTGDVVVATEVLQHDLDPRPLFGRWEIPSLGLTRIPCDVGVTAALSAAAVEVVSRERTGLGAAAARPAVAHRGLIISGDQFVGTAEQAERLRADLPDALAVEMEGAALAYVCRVAGVPFGIVRTISDGADDGAAVDFPRFLSKVAAPYARDLVAAALPLIG